MAGAIGDDLVSRDGSGVRPGVTYNGADVFERVILRC